MPPATQKQRQMAVHTPLGEDALLLTAFRGVEEISRPFEFHLEMLSEQLEIRPADIVAKNVTFAIRADPQADEPRYYNGFVRDFRGGPTLGGLRRYSAVVVPWFWFLTQTTDCRVFQNKTVPEIIQQVFGDLGVQDFDTSFLSNSGAAAVNERTREYCVQYRESDFNFVSRLMEQQGIFYYFRHENGRHIMMLSDSTSAYQWCGIRDLEHRVDAEDTENVITVWEHQYQAHSARWSHTDYDYHHPQSALYSSEQSLNQSAGELEQYDYPGGFSVAEYGRNLARIRMESEELQGDCFNATSTCKLIGPATKFTIRTNSVQEEDLQSYVVTRAEYEAIEPSEYVAGQHEANGVDPKKPYLNRLSCIPESVVFRAPSITRVPVVQGPQTANVVGPEGEEIHTDELGQVKIQFHWDREGTYNENSSCWVRVSQGHAGAGFGAIHIPRVGEEVIVSFLEGDPDRPIITGRVYNADLMPPFPLPESKRISGWKSNSTPDAAGFNQLTFDDTKGRENITIHAQKDELTTVENDKEESVKHNAHLNVSNDRVRQVGNDESVTIFNDQIREVKHDCKLIVGNDAQISIQGNKVEGVKKNIAVYSGSKITIVAEDEIMFQVGASVIHMTKDGQIILDGNNVLIRGKNEFYYRAAGITGEANDFHHFRGAMIKHNVD